MDFRKLEEQQKVPPAAMAAFAAARAMRRLAPRAAVTAAAAAAGAGYMWGTRPAGTQGSGPTDWRPSGSNLMIFAGSSCRVLAGEIANELGVKLGSADIGAFADGESKVRRRCCRIGFAPSAALAPTRPRAGALSRCSWTSRCAARTCTWCSR